MGPTLIVPCSSICSSFYTRMRVRCENVITFSQRTRIGEVKHVLGATFVTHYDTLCADAARSDKLGPIKPIFLIL